MSKIKLILKNVGTFIVAVLFIAFVAPLAFFHELFFDKERFLRFIFSKLSKDYNTQLYYVIFHEKFKLADNLVSKGANLESCLKMSLRETSYDDGSLNVNRAKYCFYNIDFHTFSQEQIAYFAYLFSNSDDIEICEYMYENGVHLENFKNHYGDTWVTKWYNNIINHESNHRALAFELASCRRLQNLDKFKELLNQGADMFLEGDELFYKCLHHQQYDFLAELFVFIKDKDLRNTYLTPEVDFLMGKKQLMEKLIEEMEMPCDNAPAYKVKL